MLPCLDDLKQLGCDYAFYCHPAGQSAQLYANAERFVAASLIKIPILLAWVMLERSGEVDRGQSCCLDDEPQVEGAGLAWLLRTRTLTYQDALLMMLALSDNLCTNLVVQRMGLERCNNLIQTTLGLRETHLQRRMMELEARVIGRENWISPADCARWFDLLHGLRPGELAWIEPMLAANQDDLLLRRNLARDSISFFHKTGSLPGVLHDWGYTRACDLFLLTQNVSSEPAVFRVFGQLGQSYLCEGNS